MKKLLEVVKHWFGHFFHRHRCEVRETATTAALTGPAYVMRWISIEPSNVILRGLVATVEFVKDVAERYSHGSHLITLFKWLGARIPCGAKSLGCFLWTGFFASSCSVVLCVAIGLLAPTLLGVGLHAFINFVR